MKRGAARSCSRWRKLNGERAGSSGRDRRGRIGCDAEIAGDSALPDRLTTTKENIAFASSLGLTTVHDVGGNGRAVCQLNSGGPAVFGRWRAVRRGSAGRPYRGDSRRG